MPKLRAPVGSVGRTVADLRPSGKIDVLGVVHEARSEGLWIEAGRQVVVLRADAFGLVVREANGDEAKSLAAAALQRQPPDQPSEVTSPPSRWLVVRHLVEGAALGAILGGALVWWLRTREGGSPPTWPDAAFVAYGLGFGLAYVLFLREYFKVVRSAVSAICPEHPGYIVRLILPTLGCVGGAILGLLAGGTQGAVVGAVLGGMLLAPGIVIVLLLAAEVLS
jgi:hypothetical protein